MFNKSKFDKAFNKFDVNKSGGICKYRGVKKLRSDFLWNNFPLQRGWKSPVMLFPTPVECKRIVQCENIYFGSLF